MVVVDGIRIRKAQREFTELYFAAKNQRIEESKNQQVQIEMNGKYE